MANQNIIIGWPGGGISQQRTKKRLEKKRSRECLTKGRAEKTSPDATQNTSRRRRSWQREKINGGKTITCAITWGMSFGGWVGVWLLWMLRQTREGKQYHLSHNNNNNNVDNNLMHYSVQWMTVMLVVAVVVGSRRWGAWEVRCIGRCCCCFMEYNLRFDLHIWTIVFGFQWCVVVVYVYVFSYSANNALINSTAILLWQQQPKRSAFLHSSPDVRNNRTERPAVRLHL